MKCVHPEKLFKQFPQLQEIADRLEKSEQQANEKSGTPSNTQTCKDCDGKGKKEIENPQGENPQGGNTIEEKCKPCKPCKGTGSIYKRGYSPPHAEHFLISRYRKNGIWKNTVYSSESGKQEFVNAVDTCLNNNDPDAITVRLFPRSSERNTKNKKAQEVDVYFSDEAERAPEKSQFEDEMKNRLNGLEEKLANSVVEPNSTHDLLAEVKMLRKDNEFTLEKIKITTEYEAKLKTLQDENEALQQELEKADSDIESLEADLAESEKGLGSVHEHYQKKEQSPLIPILGAAIENGFKGLAMKHPVLLEGFNLSEEQKKKLLGEFKDGKKIEQGAENKNGKTSFEDAPSGIDADLKDKSKEHADALKNFWLWLKALPLEQFKTVYTINFSMLTKEGTLDEEIAKAIAEKIEDAKKTETTTAE